jgi:hypothetical protein
VRLPKVGLDGSLARSTRCSGSWLIVESWCLGSSSKYLEAVLLITFFVATGASYGRWMVADAIVGRLLSLYASDDARVRDFHVRL